MQTIKDNILQFHSDAIKLSGKPPTLVCVSKQQSPDKIRMAYQAGEHHFGENYVAEALEKITLLTDLPDVNWHYIGRIQRNKTALIAKHFDWVQSVDRLSVAQRLSVQRPSHLAPLNICIQVNIDNEPQKSGVLPNAVLALAKIITALPQLTLRGLMCIGAKSADDKAASFARMQQLFQTLCDEDIPLDTLSMGMSSDWPLAVQHGATMVRLGTQIFGER